MSKLDDVIKSINKDYKFNIVGKADIKKREYKRIPFKTPALTWLFKGGLPRGIVLELSGIMSAGKSTLSASIVGEAQKLFIEEWEEEVHNLETKQETQKLTAKEKERLAYLQERGYQKVLYVDTEFSVDPDWFEINGVDMQDLVFVAPENQSAEQILEIVLNLIETDGIGLVIIDSIPAMVSQQAMGKTLEEKTMAGISGCLTTFSNKVMPLCNKYVCTVIGINQSRDDMSGYNQVITPGGKAWKHACSIRCVQRKEEYYDDSYKNQNSHFGTPYGNNVKIEVIKNKATGVDRRLTQFSITYDMGIDYYNDTFEMAVTLKVLTQAGAWFSLEDENGDVITLEDGTLLKWQGKKAVLQTFRENEDIFKLVSDRLNAVILES